MGKREFLCVESLAVDEAEYGVDFIAGRLYVGDVETGYVESSENGTSVLFDGDLFDYFIEFDKSRGNVDEQYRAYVIEQAFRQAMCDLYAFGFVRYMLPTHDYCIEVFVDRNQEGLCWVMEPKRIECGERASLGFSRQVEYKDDKSLRQGFAWCLDLIDEDQTMKLVRVLTDAKTRSEIRGVSDVKDADDFVK